MFEVKKKLVYQLDQLKNYHGMIPLHVYTSLIYFNYDDEDKSKNESLLSLTEISNFITQCLVEAITSEINIKTDDLREISLNDFYMSSIPSFMDNSTYKILTFRVGNKKIIVSEAKIENREGFKMRSFSKEELMRIVFGVHQIVLHLLSDVIKQCNGSKKIALIKDKETPEQENTITEDEINENKFDKSNYIQL